MTYKHILPWIFNVPLLKQCDTAEEIVKKEFENLYKRWLGRQKEDWRDSSWKKDELKKIFDEVLSKYYKVDESTMTIGFGAMAFDKALDKLAEKMLPIMY